MPSDQVLQKAELQKLETELKRLQELQDKAADRAIYVRLSKEELQEADERRKRIHELYEKIIALLRATQS